MYMYVLNRIDVGIACNTEVKSTEKWVIITKANVFCTKECDQQVTCIIICGNQSWDMFDTVSAQELGIICGNMAKRVLDN